MLSIRRLSLETRALLIAAVLGIGLAITLTVASWVGVAAIFIILIFCLAWIWPERPRSSQVLWWMNPSWALLLALTPGLLLCASLPESTFLDQWHTPKYFTLGHGILTLGLALTFVIGAQGLSRLIAEPSKRNFFADPSTEARFRLERATRVLFWVTVVGYITWASIGIVRGLRPGDVASIFTGGGLTAAKSFLAPIGGVTTIAQFGPLTVVCLMILRHIGSDIRTRRYLVALFALAMIRNFVYGERLAVLELAIPAIITALALPRPRTRPRPAFTLLPIWAPVVLLLFFGSFEYFRSYSSDFYQREYAGRSYADFTVTRMGAYYATAANNSVLVQRSDQRARHIPYYVVAGVWNFPLIGGVVPYEKLAGSSVGRDYADTLEAKANPEYNNTGGMLLPVFDLGVTGAVGFWLLVGGAIGVVFRRFRAGDIRGLLLYPVLFVGVAECALILYWPTGRAIPSLVGGVILGRSLYRSEQDRATTSGSVGERANEPNFRAGARAPVKLTA